MPQENQQNAPQGAESPEFLHEITSHHFSFRERIWKVIDYCSAGKYFNSIGLAFLARAVMQGYFEQEDKSTPNFLAIYGVTALANFIIGYCQYRGFLRMRNLFENGKFDEWLLITKSRSPCDRNAARVAARGTGYEEELEIFFRRCRELGQLPLRADRRDAEEIRNLEEPQPPMD